MSGQLAGTPLPSKMHHCVGVSDLAISSGSVLDGWIQVERVRLVDSCLMSYYIVLHLIFASWVNFDILILGVTARVGRRVILADFCPTALEGGRHCCLEASNDERTDLVQNLVQIELFAFVEVDAWNVVSSAPMKAVVVVEAQLC